jgi:Kef-type K+ transport system membrane component KefB
MNNSDALGLLQAHTYILLVLGLFVLPHLMERFRLPSAITSLGLGVVASLTFGWFQGDQTITLLATLGIVALFLFAGLDADFALLKRDGPVILVHLAWRSLGLVLISWAAATVFDLGWRPAFLVALALLTPSTGFILSSLDGFGLSQAERDAVKTKAIAGEVLALVGLFLCLQSVDTQRFLVSGAAVIGLVMALPIAFWIFATYLLPRGPKTEFAFLMVMAIVCASVTKMLGAYYLLGAFIAGIIAQRTRHYVPAMVSPRMVETVEIFAAFFIPFYFFHAGLELRCEDFSWPALFTGAAFLAIALPGRILALVAHRRWVHPLRDGQPVRAAIALLPTLVFTLVLAAILRDQFAVPAPVFGGLIVYTLVNTLLPGFLLRTPAAKLDFTSPEIADVPAPPDGPAT